MTWTPARTLVLADVLESLSLDIQHFTGVEQLGECFEYVLTLYRAKADLKAEDLLGQHASIRVKVGKHPELYFDGIVCDFGSSGFFGRYLRWNTAASLSPPTEISRVLPA